MSNSEAAAIYADIIEDVIAESRQDFENSGIDEATLQDLRKIWMDRLAQSQVANFPWSKSETAEVNEDSNSLALHTTSGDGDLYQTLMVGQVGEETQSQEQQQGSQQQPSVSGLNSSVSGASGLEYPGVASVTSVQAPKQENSGLVLPTGGRIVNQGDGNFELIIEADSKSDALKFMKELKRRNKKRITIRQADGLGSDDDDDDEDDDDDDDDEDLDDKDGGIGSDDINSDLDDSDSVGSDDESDEQEGNIMLCLYDKVQRVKNKWKCNLKEGIASLNGKDYTFQKLTSESEW